MEGQIVTDLRAEADRVVGEIVREGIAARLTGGLAIASRCPAATRPPLAREYADLDLVCGRRATTAVSDFLQRLGYTADRDFNAVHGSQRLYFLDPDNGRHIDVFVGAVRMCHTIELADRLQLLSDTLTPSDLLLTKLQIVELNQKDLLDLLALVHDQPLRPGYAEALDPEYLAGVWGSDWPLWRTSRQTLEQVRDGANRILSGSAQELALARVAALVELLEGCAKTRRWRLRARVGEHVRWYELPEEIEA